MKVVSFNIRCCNDGDGHRIEERAPRVKKVLEKYEPDLVGFQEAVPMWMEYIEADYGKDYEIFNKWRAEDNHESTPMMWKKDKFECLRKGYFWLSDTPETESKGWDELYDCYRICLWAVLKEKQTGKIITFVNTHYGFGDNGQEKSGKLIIERIEQLGHPAVLTGDFNLTMDSLGYKILVNRLSDVNMETVKDESNTFHGYKLSEGKHIDYCFITPETVKPVTSILMNETFEGKFPSDHYGICSEIEL